MILKEITPEEVVKQRMDGYPGKQEDNQETIIEDKIVKKEQELSEQIKEIISKDEDFLNKELKEIENSKNQFEKNQEDIYNKFVENRKYLLNLVEEDFSKDAEGNTLTEEQRYSGNYEGNYWKNAEAFKIFTRTTKLVEDTYNKHTDYKEALRDAEKLISKILVSIYSGVLIDDRLSVRKEGIYPYKCQNKMDYEQVISELVKFKPEVINKTSKLSKEKFDIILEIYKIIDNLNISIESSRYHASIRSESRLFELNRPYIIQDALTPFIDDEERKDDAAMILIEGIKLDYTRNYSGVHFLEKLLKRYNNEGNRIQYQPGMKKEYLFEDVRFNGELYKFLLIKFNKIISYLANTELDMMNKKIDYIETNKDVLKMKASKYLIANELMNGSSEDN